jgi:hypothetical protein
MQASPSITKAEKETQALPVAKTNVKNHKAVQIKKPYKAHYQQPTLTRLEIITDIIAFFVIIMLMGAFFNARKMRREIEDLKAKLANRG